MTKYLNNSPELKEFRRGLRNNLTSAEVTLRKYIKNRQLEDRKFRRQFSISKYILDFYCVEEKLAIELDGNDHYSVAGYESDVERDAFLNKLGIKVLRFENNDVFKNLEEVFRRNQKAFYKMKVPATRGGFSPHRGNTEGLGLSAFLLNYPFVFPLKGETPSLIAR